ncbi:MAG TPA: sulfite exporter TauE/SafE family protein [Candidatus Binatia bacterium]|jgi:uncharacterized membrane protein YfcA
MDYFALTSYQALYFAGVFFLASFVKGTSSFGYSLVATPLLALSVGLKQSIATLMLPNLLMDLIFICRRGGVKPRQLADLKWFYVGAFPTIYLGTKIVVTGSPSFLLFFLGCTTLAYVALSALREPIMLEKGTHPPRDAFLGGLYGGFLGVTNAAGPVAAIYLTALGQTKSDFVKNFALISLLTKAVQLSSISYYQILSVQTALLSLLMLVPLGAGFLAGIKMQDQLSESQFNQIILLMLAATGIGLIWQASGELLGNI